MIKESNTNEMNSALNEELGLDASDLLGDDLFEPLDFEGLDDVAADLESAALAIAEDGGLKDPAGGSGEGNQQADPAEKEREPSTWVCSTEPVTYTLSKTQPSPPPSSSHETSATSAPTETEKVAYQYLTSADLNCHDVLCGKGRGTSNSPGNKHLRTLITPRLAEYLACNVQGKNAIAREICHHITQKLEPRGRFLKRATKDQAKGWGFGSNNDVWLPVDAETMTERIKQGFRDIKRPRSQAAAASRASDGGISNQADVPKSSCSNMNPAPNMDPVPGLLPSSTLQFQSMFALSNAQNRSGAEKVGASALQPHFPPSAPSPDISPDPMALLELAQRMLKNITCVRGEEHERQLLHGLGLRLYQEATGRAPPLAPGGARGTDGSSSRAKRGRPGTARHDTNALVEAGYPVAVSMFVASLLDAPNASAAERFASIADVKEEIAVILGKPNKYLLGPDSMVGDRMMAFMEHQLHGREREVERLHSAYQDAVQGTGDGNGLVVISGLSGTGKTSLAETLQAHLSQSRGRYIAVKFDDREDSMTTFFRALDHYCEELLGSASHADLAAEVGLQLKMALGSYVGILQHLMPNLGILVGGYSASTGIDMQGSDIYNVLMVCLQMFVRTIAAPSHPVVIVFDDCQWAAQQTLDVIEKLATDSLTNSLLIIGTYRSNEVGDDLTKRLGSIAMAGTLLFSIRLENLEKTTVNSLVSDALYLTPRVTRPLAQALYNKTGGNPMFVKRFIKSMVEDGLLQFSAESRRWRWDIKAINDLPVTENAVEFFSNKMEKYPRNVQWFLRVVSSLGFQFNRAVLVRLYSGARNDLSSSFSKHSDGETSVEREIMDLLDAAIDVGLVMKGDDADSYKFTHDQLHAAAYALTPPSDQHSMNLMIGRQLLDGISEDELDTFIFDIVDQLNRGVDLMTDHDERLRLAELNLKAGEKSRSDLFFLQASIYLLQGRILLSEEDWSDHYGLCLRLYISCAEVQFTQGNKEEAIASLSLLSNHAKCLQDMLPACYILTEANFHLGKFDDAMHSGLKALRDLGAPLEPCPDKSAVLYELSKTREMIESTSVESILQKDAADDWQIVEKARFLTLVLRMAYVGSQELMFLAVLRAVQMAVTEESLTPDACYAFGMLSHLLHQRDYDLAIVCGNICEKLINKFGGKHANGSTFILNTSTLPFTQPMQACVESFRDTQRKAMSLGDVNVSMNALHETLFVGLYAPERGKTLGDLEDEIRQGIKETAPYQSFGMQFVMLNFQPLLNLRGPLVSDPTGNSDPTILTGEVLNQDEMLPLWSEKKMNNYLRRFYFFRMWLAYLFRRHEKAAELFELHQNVVALMRFYSSAEWINDVFYTGLIAAAQLRSGATDNACKWRSLAEKALKKLRFWNENANAWNFQHKYDLLKAEIAVIDRDYGYAATKYDDAIQTAGSHSFINEEALACERAGLFYLQERGNLVVANQYLVRAEQLYRNWGAARKAADVLAMMQDVMIVYEQ